MSGDLRFGVVGCSWVAPYFADGLRTADGARLVACADVDPDTGREFADEQGLEAWYEDYERMIEESRLDAVCVCTPSGTHAEIVTGCARAGVDVLCEKPLDVTVEKVDAMIRACDRAGVTLGGVFQRRTHSAARRAKEAVERGELGEVVLASSRLHWHRSQEYYDRDEWRGTGDLDGGVLMNQAIHGIDTVQWLTGGIERVTCTAGTLVRDIEADDTAVVTVEHANGALGTVEATTGTYPERPLTVEVHGDEGSFVLDIDNNEFVDFRTADGPVEFQSEQTEFGDGHARQIRDFVSAVVEGREPAVTGREARNAVAAVIAMYESDRTGRPVAVDRLGEQ